MSTAEELALVHRQLPWFFPAFAALFGACVGSFLNVCIYRIPAGRSVVRPGSHCACGAPVRWFDNIPVLSWLLLRGRARCCGRRFSVRYPAIELLTALLFLVCAAQFGPGKAVAAMLFVSLLTAASFIDIDHMIIPDRFSIGGAVVGVVLSLALPSLHGHEHPLFAVASVRSGVDAVAGLLVGSAIVLWIGMLAEIVLRKEAMGFGDVKLLGCIGAFVGWKGAVFSIFGGATLGVLATLVWLLFRRKPVEPGPDQAAASGAPAAASEEKPGAAGEPASVMAMPVPFGPMLSAAGVLYLLWLQPWVDGLVAAFTEGLFA
jgi:leader peptidase (prepilin peptidase) / N-methyltransferase